VETPSGGSRNSIALTNAWRCRKWSFMPRTDGELLGGTNQFLKETFVRKPQCESRKRKYSQTDK